MPEKPMPRIAALLMPLAAIVFVIGGFSTLGEVLLHSPHFYTPVIALAFALGVTFGAAALSWWLGRAERRGT
jgi:hypothetical protein